MSESGPVYSYVGRYGGCNPDDDSDEYYDDGSDDVEHEISLRDALDLYETILSNKERYEAYKAQREIAEEKAREEAEKAREEAEIRAAEYAKQKAYELKLKAIEETEIAEHNKNATLSEENKIEFVILSPENTELPKAFCDMFNILPKDPITILVGPDNAEALGDLNKILPSGLECVKVATNTVFLGRQVCIIILKSQRELHTNLL